MILIVDDFHDGAEALCKILHRMGYPCEWVSSGHEALVRIRSHPPEQPLLVILDDMMPQMSGIEVLRAMRAEPQLAHVPVIMHSAASDVARRGEAQTLERGPSYSRAAAPPFTWPRDQHRYERLG